MKIALSLMIVLQLMLSMAIATDEMFDVTIVISSSIEISEDNGLTFGNVESLNSAQNIVVEPGDPGSAQFDITGSAGSVSWSVTENNINMISGSDNIMVNSFKVSGTGNGNLPQENIRVGATAHVGSNQPSGSYIGIATFNVVYN